MATSAPASPRNSRHRTTAALKTTLAATLLLLGTAAHAGGTYLEGRAGAINLANLSGQGSIDSTIGFARLTGQATGNIGYDSAIMLGAEVGVEGVFGTSLRVSASIDAFEPKVSSAVLTADLSINGVKVPDTPDGAPLLGSEVADLGLDFEHRIAILSGNGFFDFDLGGFTPYVGAGYGLLLVESADQYESGILLHAGVRYNVTPLFFIGARVSWFRADGPQDGTGIDFDTFETTSAGLSLGIRL